MIRITMTDSWLLCSITIGYYAAIYYHGYHSSIRFVAITHDGSMVLLYMVLHGSHQYTPVMLAYIPAPWIRHGLVIVTY